MKNMSLIVMKFGGTSVKDAERVRNVAGIVTDSYKQGNSVVVVVSAQGDTTDDLIEKAAEITANPTNREMDMLLTSGEQISASLLAMCIQDMGYPAISLTGWQAGFLTSSAHSAARIRQVYPDRIKREIDQKKIVVVCGSRAYPAMTISPHSDAAAPIPARSRSRRRCTPICARSIPT